MVVHWPALQILGEKFSVKKSFACGNGDVKRTETRQRWNHEHGGEETNEDYPTSVPHT